MYVLASGPSMNTAWVWRRRAEKIGPCSRSSGNRIDSGSCAIVFVRARLKLRGPGGNWPFALRWIQMSPATRPIGLWVTRRGAGTVDTRRIVIDQAVS